MSSLIGGLCRYKINDAAGSSVWPLPAVVRFIISPVRYEIISWDVVVESVILKDPELGSMKSSFPSGAWYRFTGTAEPNVRIHIRRSVVQVQRERPIIRRIIPIATTNGCANERLDPFVKA